MVCHPIFSNPEFRNMTIDQINEILLVPIIDENITRTLNALNNRELTSNRFSYRPRQIDPSRIFTLAPQFVEPSQLGLTPRGFGRNSPNSQSTHWYSWGVTILQDVWASTLRFSCHRCPPFSNDTFFHLNHQDNPKIIMKPQQFTCQHCDYNILPFDCVASILHTYEHKGIFYVDLILQNVGFKKLDNFKPTEMYGDSIPSFYGRGEPGWDTDNRDMLARRWISSRGGLNLNVPIVAQELPSIAGMGNSLTTHGLPSYIVKSENFINEMSNELLVTTKKIVQGENTVRDIAIRVEYSEGDDW